MVKDTTYASLFDKKDTPLLYKYAQKVRETHDQELVDNFNKLCQDKWNDKHPVLTIGNETIEPTFVSKADDLVVSAGLDHSINQILGTSVVRWQYMGKGSGGGAVLAANTTLATETLPRADMSLFGWREYAGASLRFAGIFGESIVTPPIAYSECGIFTTSTVGTMLNRNVFSVSISHQQDIDSFVLSCVIEFVPVV